MILNDTDIRYHVQRHKIAEPFNEARLSGASYDVALHRKIKVEAAYSKEAVWIDHDLRGDGDYCLQPGEFILAATEEIIRVPLNMAAEFRLKSSRAREGWQHNLAVWIDPGFEGRITLELSNCSRYKSLAVEPGLLIGQIIWHQLTQRATISYAETGHYQGATEVQGSWEIEQR